MPRHMREKRAAIAALPLDYFLTSPGAGVGLGAPELSFSAGICELAGACPLVAGPDAPGAVAAGPLIVPLCWGWGAPELSYCFGVCCCAKATPALTSNAAPAKITNCFLIKRCPVFAPYRRFIRHKTTPPIWAGSGTTVRSDYKDWGG
jgi:hypothetical protein